MTKKKKTLLAAVSAAVIIAIVGVILAYFGAKDEEPNLVGVGENDISVAEEFTPPEQTNEPFKYRKLVKIENTGSIPCYVRVRLEFSNSDVQSCASFSADETDTPADSTFYSADINASNPYISNLPAGWEYVKDQSTDDPTAGYYYYKTPVDPESSTAALISWVKMNYDGNEIQAHDIYVYSESVQTIDPTTGTDYDDWKAAWKGL